MPTYEYACTRCGQHVEVFQRLSEPPLQVCGVCGGPVRKVFHPAGIVFKGSGFYATDNRSKPRTETSEKKSGEGKGDGASASPAATSSDSGSSSASGSSSSDGASKSKPAAASGEKTS